MKMNTIKERLWIISFSVLLFTTANAQSKKVINGSVVDESNRPIIGATIEVINQDIFTITDQSGNFHVEFLDNLNTTLKVSSVGYKTLEVPLNEKTSVTITMTVDASSLGEVVVVGFGEQKKVNLTGSVATVDSKDIGSRPATSVTSLLQGKMSGVNITQTSGQPGREGTSILIRGLGTMNNAQPLVIIDGVESSLDDVNPNDIASISVLKDAAAAAIYGTRAANGVILVTTKRGEVGAMKITYNMYLGRQKATRLPQALSSADYARLYNEGLKNEGLPPSYTEDDIRKYEFGDDPENFPNTDWMDLLLQGSGLTQNHNLAFSGGDEKTQYRISLEYYQQNGLVKYTNEERYNFRLNLDSKVTRWFKVGVNTGLSRRKITAPVSPYGVLTQFFRQVNRIPPIFINRYEDGSWGRHIDGNPIAWVEAGGLSDSKYSHLLGSTFGEATIMKGLSLKGTIGIDYSFDDSKSHIKTIAYHNGTVQGPNSVSDYLGRNQNITLQALLNYQKAFDNHDIKIMLGTSRQSYQNNIDQAYRKNFPTNILAQLDAGSSEGWSNSGNALQSRLGSYFGRLNYIYNNKYLFEANLRRDGSSRFADGQRWGLFPSFSAGWKLSEEEFFRSVSWIDNLKFRGSWGKLGNDRINDYLYISTISLGQNYSFGGVIADGAATTVANNPVITWETATELDIGFDAIMFKGQLSITADYYNRLTDNILTTVPVSQVFGLPAPTVNAGAMRNRGVEFQMQHSNNFEGIHYSISLNGSYNKNLVVRYKNPSKGDQVYMEGVPWGSYYGYQVIGIFQTDEEADTSPHPIGAPVKAGDLKFKDQNRDSKIDGDDRIVLGNAIPEITYGFNVNVGFKGIDLSIFLQGASRVFRTLGAETEWPFNNGGTALKMHLDRTIVENGNISEQGYYPRTLINQGQNRVMSSFQVLNSSYLRMKNLQLGYSLPNSWVRKMSASNARIYFSGENLITITKFPKVADPEVASNVSNSIYPQVKFYTVGLNLTF